MIKSGIPAHDRDIRLYEEACELMQKLDEDDFDQDDEDDIYINTSYYARKTVKPVTLTLKKKAKLYEDFQKDVKSGKVRYGKNDENFRDKNGFIRLGFRDPIY